mgnify:CR=1 FL=1
MDDYVKQLEDAYEELSKHLAKVIPWVPVWEEVHYYSDTPFHKYCNFYTEYGRVKPSVIGTYFAQVGEDNVQFKTLEEAKAYIETKFGLPDVE